MNIVKVTKGIIAFAILSCAALVTGQTPVSPLLQPRQSFLDRNGTPCVQCRLWSYTAGTTTIQYTYTDSTGATQNPDPIILDSSGSASVWPAAGQSYKYVLTNPAGAVIWTQDHVTGPQQNLGYTPVNKAGDTMAGPLNSIVWASASASPATVSNPSLSAGLSSLSTGGTVAANTYYAEITYVGAGGGETLPSPLDSFNQYATTTTGSTSTLYCNAQEAPAGATGFRCYIRTGGSGSFYLQGGTNALGSVLAITTTPVTSGTTPPVSNTATASLAAAQASFGGSPGLWETPSSIATSTGASGDPASGAGQTNIDARYGSIESTCGGSHAERTSTYGAVLGCWNVDMTLPSQLTTGQQAQGFSAAIHASNTPFYGGGVNPFNPSAAVAGFFYAERGGTRSESIWAINPVVAVTNQNNPAYASELSVFNQSGSDASSLGGGVGEHIANLGNNKAYYGIWITEGNNGFASADVRLEDAPCGTQGCLTNTSLYLGKYHVTSFDAESPALFHTGGAAFQVVPPADDYNASLFGRNAANNATVWEIDDNGFLKLEGPNAGIYTSLFVSANSNPAQSGIVRLTNTDQVVFRNAGNTADLALGVNGSNQLTFNGTAVSAIASGVATLASGTVTVNTAAACSVSSTCIYQVTRCASGSSTAVGTPTIGTVTAGTSFVINSLSSTNTVVTGDLASVCWTIY